MGSPSGYQTCYQVNQINITQLVEAWGGPCLQAVQMDGNGCWSSIASYYCRYQVTASHCINQNPACSARNCVGDLLVFAIHHVS